MWMRVIIARAQVERGKRAILKLRRQRRIAAHQRGGVVVMALWPEKSARRQSAHTG